MRDENPNFLQGYFQQFFKGYIDSVAPEERKRVVDYMRSNPLPSIGRIVWFMEDGVPLAAIIVGTAEFPNCGVPLTSLTHVHLYVMMPDLQRDVPVTKQYNVPFEGDHEGNPLTAQWKWPPRA